MPGEICRWDRQRMPDELGRLTRGRQRSYAKGVKSLAGLTIAARGSRTAMERVVHGFSRRHKEGMQATSIAITGGGAVNAPANGRAAANAADGLPSFAQVIAEKVANPPASEKDNAANHSQDRS